MKKSNLLLSLTFVPTVTALAISCSSNGDANTVQKNPTTIKENIQASEFGWENKVASVAINDINENFIFNNKNKFLMGDYELSSPFQIISINKSIASDKTSILVSFKLAPKAWYDANGKLGEVESSLFSTTISNFKVPSTGKVATNIKDAIYASEIGFSNKMASEVIDSINDQFIYSKLSSILLGDYNITASNQITSINKTIQSNQSSISLSFTLNPKTWYDENGELGTTNKTFTTIIQGFKSPLKNPTSSNASISISALGWSEDKDINEANNLLDLKFIFDHRSIFLTGDYNLSTYYEITSISKSIGDNNTSITVTFGLAANTWYDTDGTLGKTSKLFTTKIVGFKSTVVNTLNLKDQKIFNWGDNSIEVLNDLVTNEYLKTKIIENKDQLLNIPDPAKYNEQFFKQNLSITNSGKNNLEGFVTVSIQINNNSETLVQNICIKGFKKFNESSITFPTISNPTNPTEQDLTTVADFWKNMPLGLDKTYFSQSELEQLDDDALYYSLIDLRTNQTPLPLTDAMPADVNINFECAGTTVDYTNHLIKTKIYIYTSEGNNTRYKFVDKEFSYKPFESTAATQKDIVNKISSVAKIVTVNEEYKNIKAKLFSRYNQTEIKKYFDLNNTEMSELFWIEPEYQNVTKTFICPEEFYNFKTPTQLNFEIQIQYTGHPEISTNKIQTISGFKDVQTIGTLDKAPIVSLLTPQGAVSYKGELEKYYFDEFVTTTKVNYNDFLNKMSYDDVKKEIMYQARFYLYQMFSDNYSEINYYIINENPTNHTFTAIAEGIIKDNKANVFYGFQPHIASNGVHATSSVKTGDKIKIELKFDPKYLITGYKPTPFERGEGKPGDFTYSWYWDYGDKCTNYINSNSPSFKDDIPRSRFVVVHWAVYINNQPTINDNVNNYGSPVLSSPFIILKSTK